MRNRRNPGRQSPGRWQRGRKEVVCAGWQKEVVAGSPRTCRESRQVTAEVVAGEKWHVVVVNGRCVVTHPR